MRVMACGALELSSLIEFHGLGQEGGADKVGVPERKARIVYERDWVIIG
jgi:hypothetical protein